MIPYEINLEIEQEALNDGVILKELLPLDEQQTIFESLTAWFNANEEFFPETGIVIYADRNLSGDNSLTPISEFGEHKEFLNIDLPSELTFLLNAILRDSEQYEELARNRVRFLIERTGDSSSFHEDQNYHIDSWKVIWDELGNRIGYDNRRSLEKYMVYVGRVGSLVVEGKINPDLNVHEANAIGLTLNPDYIAASEELANNEYTPIIFQLLPNSIYLLAVGDLLHSAPPHDEGILITASYNI